ncbi:hypothetical protein DHEL01_v210759 [Diaporthe helianthi]|uniref:Uncharacterized protein n=1 Tax=Diaporthe helianthi TaxID=158607 RepID=A0A2P5HKS2_DIAHE|nr:hypothetical protein DHEL01_v210759 [Diaporthe helianthi]
MRLFFMLASIPLAILALVSAEPIPTATLRDLASRVIVGPRRNGNSDMPSSVGAYNIREPENAIPQWVTASNPTTGQDAIIYSQEEIYNALREGYETLQRTRDPSPGQPQQYGNVQYPVVLEPNAYNLEETHYGRFDGSIEIDMYMWPLLWTNGYTGHNQNPGEDRVVFNQDGVYLGVITRRPGPGGGGYRWCPPSNVQGNWVARWIGEPRGWDYTGVPPEDGQYNYRAPSNWNVASSQRDWWFRQNQNGRPPTGSHDKMYNSSVPLDYNNPLDLPPADNSTGVWFTYEPSNFTSNLTHVDAVASDCKLAHDHGAVAYQQSCQTHWDNGANKMSLRITVSGTGQNNWGWCKGVIDQMYDKCGGNFNLAGNVYACDRYYPGTATFSRSTGPSDPEYGKYYFGIDMHMWLAWPWAQSDADHACIADAVEQASCASGDVKSRNGKWCRNVDWRPATPLVEWSSDLGPA